MWNPSLSAKTSAIQWETFYPASLLIEYPLLFYIYSQKSMMKIGECQRRLLVDGVIIGSFISGKICDYIEGKSLIIVDMGIYIVCCIIFSSDWPAQIISFNFSFYSKLLYSLTSEI